MAALQVSIIQLQQQQPWPAYPIVSEHFNLAQNESTTRKLTFNLALISIRSYYYYYYTPHSCRCELITLKLIGSQWKWDIVADSSHANLPKY